MSFAQRGHRAVIVAAEEITVEGDVASQAVRADLHLREPQVAFLVLAQAEVVDQPGPLAALEPRAVLLEPGLHRGVVSQLLERNPRQIDEVLGQLQWVQPRQALQSLHHRTVVVDQPFQRFASQAWGVLVDVQAGLFEEPTG